MLPPNERRAIAVALLAIVAIAALAYLLAGLIDTPFASALSIVVAPAAVGLYWLQQTLTQRRHLETREHLVLIDDGRYAGGRFELSRETRFHTLYGPGPFTPPAPSVPAPSWLESELKSWKDGKMGWNPPSACSSAGLTPSKSYWGRKMSRSCACGWRTMPLRRSSRSRSAP